MNSSHASGRVKAGEAVLKQLSENVLVRDRREIGPRSAIIGVHWQNDVVTSFGALNETFSDSVRQRGAIARTAALFDHARAKGALIVYVNVVFEPDYVGLVRNNALWNMVYNSKRFVRGSHGVEIVDDLAPSSGDVILFHNRISCFYGTNLLDILVGHGIDSVYVTGVATNVAVDHTAKDAVQYGFDTYVVDDCCASADQTYHEAAIATMRVLCTGIVNSDELIDN